MADQRHLYRTQSEPSSDEQPPWKGRKRAYIARALILFNVYGIPLSFGPYLEFLYNSNNNPLRGISLVQLSLIAGTQWLCIFCAALPIGWLYTKGPFKILITIATVLACACQILRILCGTWWHLLLVHGLAQGLALGTSGTVSTLALATHYCNNIPLASMIGTSAGFLGAIVYTSIAYAFLRESRYTAACFTNFGITLVTLVTAALLMRRNPHYIQFSAAKPVAHRQPRQTTGPGAAGWIFILGYMVVFAVLFVFPTYIILMASASPYRIFPTEPTIALIAMYACSIGYAASFADFYEGNIIGPVDYLGIVAMGVGAVFLMMTLGVQVHQMTIAVWICGVVQGATVGIALSVHVKVLSRFLARGPGYWPEMPLRIATTLCFVGISAAVGIVGTAVLVEKGGEGFRWAFLVSGLMMLGGGAVMVLARFVKCGWRFWMVV